ncbi:MAG: cell division protein FtsA [Clostridia bacterium]|nr:cell division protein FtsA [Clostridia bacterium]
MPKGDIVAGLDIGASKIVALIAEVDAEGRFDIIGLGESLSGGLRKGVIIDLEHTARAIERAVEQAERMSGEEIRSVYVGVTGPHIASLNNRGVVAVANEDKEIQPEDVERVLQAARVIPLTADKQIIHVLPRQYIVDGYDGVVDPVGMTGSRLEVEAVIITAASAALLNTLKCVQRARLQVEELVLNPLASAEAVLHQAEKELGAVLVDIGGGTTEIAIFAQGSLWFTSVLPIGGDHVTSDLAVGLRTPIAQAEKIKKEHGCVLMSLMPDNEFIEVPSVGGGGKGTVSKKTLAAIMQPRAEEIFTLVKQEIKRSAFTGLLPGGVILSGGGAMLAGMAELGAEQLQMPVRVGFPARMGGLGDMVASPPYATAVGLVAYGARRLAYAQAAATRHFSLGNLWQRFREWLREFF